MAKASSLHKLSRLGRDRVALLARAAALLVAVSAAVAVAPFRRAIALGSVPLGHPDAAAIEDYVWAIEAAARRLPCRTKCIEKGIAMQRLLRRAGLDARLHYGASPASSGKLQAHVWVTVDEEAVIGGEEAAEFVEIACFP
jgi:hypothetical protein